MPPRPGAHGGRRPAAFPGVRGQCLWGSRPRFPSRGPLALLASVVCPPRRLWPSPPFSCARFPKCLAQLALQWPSRLWAPSLARSSPSFSNPQRLRLPREARPEPQPSLLRGQTSVQPSLVRVTSPRLSGACPQRPQHPTCSGKHRARWCPATLQLLPAPLLGPRPQPGRGWGRGRAASQQRGREASPSAPPHPASVGATSEGPAV